MGKNVYWPNVEGNMERENQTERGESETVEEK